MNVIELLKRYEGERKVSFEVLPPLKGNGTGSLFASLDKLMEFNPLYINITTHHSEYIYIPLADGKYERRRIRRRPGTVAIAAAIQQRYDCPVIPHVICSGTTAEATEYELLDLQFLGIDNLLLLRGDKARDEKRYTATPNGYLHTDELIRQVNRFNEGFFADGSPIKHPMGQFHYGVAAYPEKHEEAPNMETDMAHLKVKQDLGAEYAVTQLFYDNQKYFDFVAKARAMGITIPIVPGIKPFSKLSQLNVIPKTFHCDLPQELVVETKKCKDDQDARQLGTEWCTSQCRELFEHGVRNIHFYTMGAADIVAAVAKELL